MQGTRKDQLVDAAARLLDEGGQEAVTLRAVAERVGVSHNAPYRHFSGRSALLAAVAQRDFAALKATFEASERAATDPEAALRGATDGFIAYGLGHRARYRLLFSDPGLPADEDLKAAAYASFVALSRIVERCQDHEALPKADTIELTGLIYAALHGAIDLVIGGRANDSKGLGDVRKTARLLFALLGRA